MKLQSCLIQKLKYIIWLKHVKLFETNKKMGHILQCIFQRQNSKIVRVGMCFNFFLKTITQKSCEIGHMTHCYIKVLSKIQWWSATYIITVHPNDWKTMLNPYRGCVICVLMSQCQGTSRNVTVHVLMSLDVSRYPNIITSIYIQHMLSKYWGISEFGEILFICLFICEYE